MLFRSLTGTVEGADDPNRSARAKLLYRLFDGGWDIYNSNGDQTITLGNIQQKISECDGFVFTPGANMQDIFQAASIFVGFQTNDGELCGKPAVLMNSDGSWDAFIALITHLNVMGTVHQPYDEFLTVTRKTKEVLDVLDDNYDGRAKCPAVEPDIMENKTPADYSSVIREGAPNPDYKVCVFCSASIKKEKYLDYGRYIGNAIAENGWGCVSGAGKTGIMGAVVQGCYEKGGWSGGSNVPHIIALEGLPKGLTEFWPRGDIYTRMEVMIDRSDSFIIMPGGLGKIGRAHV